MELRDNMTDIVEQLDSCTSRFAGESQYEATIRRNRTVADAKTEIATLRAKRDAQAEQARLIGFQQGLSALKELTASEDAYTIATLSAEVAALREVIAKLLPFTAAEYFAEQSAIRTGKTHRDPINKARKQASALLETNHAK